ncbi:MAG: serine hydrolase [Ignavibacteriaceae bacterium]
MKNLILSLTISLLICINLFPQHERLPIQPDEEKAIMNFSKPALMDSTTLDSIIIAHMNTYHIPGLTALINTKEDGIIWKRNYGYANIAMQRPVEDSTLFLMASISKTIVATAIMQFWEADSFDLDDNINDYLDDFEVINPYFPNDTITFRMLMMHTSSIHDYWPILTPLVICNEDSPISLDSFLVNYLSPGGVFYSSANYNSSYAPGENWWDYSNVGAVLLAYITEKFSGISFDQYCRENIFDPLEMEKTTWFLSGLDTTTLATQYKWIGGQYVPQCHQGWPLWPAGFLKTNKIELEHFLRAYMNWGKYNGAAILDSATIDLMLSDHLGYPVPEYNDVQGLVWYQYGRINNVWPWPWGHEGGWTSGTRTAMLFQQYENWGVIYFMNIYYSGTHFAHLFILNTLCDYAQEIIPVEFTSFTATAHSEKVTLNWITGSEMNNLGFEIERKQDNTDWERIGFVEGHGTTTEPQQYFYVDDISSITSNLLAYRLKQIDFDGTIDYSNVVYVENTTPTDFSLYQNYPNPFNPLTNIEYSLPVKSQVELVVFNSLGQDVKQLVNEVKEAGKYTIEVNASNLPSGVYFYQIRAGSFVETKKMILLK